MRVVSRANHLFDERVGEAQRHHDDAKDADHEGNVGERSSGRLLPGEARVAQPGRNKHDQVAHDGAAQLDDETEVGDEHAEDERGPHEGNTDEADISKAWVDYVSGT